uniref:Uncharacterized protein n=1 Tax=Arundo donax TaxID=35708 RepID=A0A0A9H5F6_ARUDO
MELPMGQPYTHRRYNGEQYSVL